MAYGCFARLLLCCCVIALSSPQVYASKITPGCGGPFGGKGPRRNVTSEIRKALDVLVHTEGEEFAAAVQTYVKKFSKKSETYIAPLAELALDSSLSTDQRAQAIGLIGQISHVKKISFNVEPFYEEIQRIADYFSNNYLATEREIADSQFADDDSQKDVEEPWAASFADLPFIRDVESQKPRGAKPNKEQQRQINAQAEKENADGQFFVYAALSMLDVDPAAIKRLEDPIKKFLKVYLQNPLWAHASLPHPLQNSENPNTDEFGHHFFFTVMRDYLGRCDASIAEKLVGIVREAREAWDPEKQAAKERIYEIKLYPAWVSVAMVPGLFDDYEKVPNSHLFRDEALAALNYFSDKETFDEYRVETLPDAMVALAGFVHHTDPQQHSAISRQLQLFTNRSVYPFLSAMDILNIEILLSSINIEIGTWEHDNQITADAMVYLSVVESVAARLAEAYAQQPDGTYTENLGSLLQMLLNGHDNSRRAARERTRTAFARVRSIVPDHAKEWVDTSVAQLDQF